MQRISSSQQFDDLQGSDEKLSVLDEYDQDTILDILEHHGIKHDDPRFRTGGATSNRLIRNCINGNLSIPEWAAFKRDIQEIYNEVKLIKKGKNADYIPELADVDPNYFAVSICTVDGQIMEIGDTKVPFSAQSCSKPITYCIAVEENNKRAQDFKVSGQDYVHNFVDREPSGRNFNDLSLNHNNIPHNPMINAGSIMSVSLIDYQLSPAHRYKKIKNYWERLSGVSKNAGKDEQVDIDNSVYLSEKLDANRNWALGFLMQEKKAFQQGKDPAFKREWKKTDLEDNLDLYFQCCSIKVNCTQMAKVGCTLANGGICPFTNDTVFDSDNVKNVLSLMYSCGMYDYSGEWSYLVGIPAKSGVSGVIYAVIPNVMCIAVYSPPLDHIGNSVKGIEFFKRFTNRFKFHVFDSFVVDSSSKKTITKEHAYQEDFKKFLLLEAASKSDIELIRKLLAQKVDINASDYDKRTALHVASSNNNVDCVKFLLDSKADKSLKDRWNNTAYDDAVKEQFHDVIELLMNKKV